MGTIARSFDDRPRSADVESPVYATGSNEAQSSGVSWAAVIAGAFVAAALSLILLSLGAGLGFSSVSPWSNVGASASTIGAIAILWLILVQIIASSMGGYITGRLRTKWTAVHNDEVFFRDTANGLVMWAVGIVMTVAFLTSAASSMVGGASTVAAGAAAGQSASAAAEPAGSAYFVDMLFRAERPVEKTDGSLNLEAARILATSLTDKSITPADRTHLARLVATRTGLSQGDAEKRVSDVIVQAKQAADDARKVAAYVLLWMFVGLLSGAFFASLFATVGGRIRDHVKAI